MKRVPNSRLIEVHFEAEDPQLAAQVVNTHLQNYVEENFRSKYDATTQASNWLSAELEELRIKVEKSEDARIAYERENQIWQIDEKQDITTQKLADLSKAVTDAQTDVAQKEALYRMAISGNVDALPAAQHDDVISNLLKRKSDLDESVRRSARSVRAELSEGSAPAGAAEGSRAKSRGRAKNHGGERRAGIHDGAQPRGIAARGAGQTEG